jgi:hypothetical protein
MTEHDAPISFAGSTLTTSRHVCAFFDDADQEHEVLDPFVREGFERGEKAFHIVDPTLRDDYLHRLRAAGIDIAAAQRNGQLELLAWEDAYLRGGHFDQNAMLALIEDVLQRGKSEGYPLTRLVAHMEWALQDRPGVNDLVEYETRLNYILPRYRDPVI